MTQQHELSVGATLLLASIAVGLGAVMIVQNAINARLGSYIGALLFCMATANCLIELCKSLFGHCRENE